MQLQNLPVQACPEHLKGRQSPCLAALHHELNCLAENMIILCSNSNAQHPKAKRLAPVRPAARSTITWQSVSSHSISEQEGGKTALSVLTVRMASVV